MAIYKTIFSLSLLLVAAMDARAVLCSRDAEVRVMSPQIDSFDDCSATAKIQGISYLCGKVEDSRSKTEEFLTTLQISGKEKCMEFCQKRATNCEGLFSTPPKCGFSVPPDKALDVGRRTPCGPECQGKAFIYCSIYHAGYLRMDESTFKDKPVNCRCQKTSK